MPSPPYRTPEAPAPEPASDPVEALGPLRSSHRPPSLALALVPAMMMGVVVAALFVAMVAVAKVGAMSLLGILPGIVVFAVGALGPLHARKVYVDMHADGVVVTRWGKRDVVAYDEVDTVWFELSQPPSILGGIAQIDALRLVDHAGVAHKVPLRLPDVERIANPILRRCSTTHLDAARAALRDGETLTFNHVRLSQEGVSFGGPVVRWSDLKLVRFQQGRVVFLRGTSLVAWRTVGLDRVPHPLVFQKLVEECAQRTEVDDPLMRLFG